MKLLSFTVAAASAALFIQTQALADGTIVVARPADDSGFSLGVSFNWDSRSGADGEAIRQCELQESQVTPAQRASCNVVATFDDQCMALAKDTGEGGTAWGWGRDDYQGNADDRAMSECRNHAGDRAGQCEITMRHCDGSADSGK